MNLQEKLFETTAELRTRAAALATTAVASLSVLKVAGRDLNAVASRHVVRLVRENRSIAMDARKELGALARSTYATFTKPVTPARRPRKPTARKRKAARAS
jgi:hypothetical protein